MALVMVSIETRDGGQTESFARAKYELLVSFLQQHGILFVFLFSWFLCSRPDLIMFCVSERNRFCFPQFRLTF